MPNFNKVVDALKEVTREAVGELQEMTMPRVGFKKVDESLPTELPTYATPGSSGVDLKSTIDYSLVAGQTYAFPTNLSVEIPFGYELQVRPRSGLALKHSVSVLNTPGTIDSDYRGEVKVILHNFGKQIYEVKKGDKIAQMVLAPVEKMNLFWKETLSDTERGTGGFNSTGR